MAKIPAKNDIGFKQAWKQSLLNHEANGKSIAELAKAAGLCESTLYATTVDDRADTWISLRRFLAILPELKDVSVLDYLESLVTPRRVAYQCPSASGAICSTRATATIMHRTAEILESKAESVSDDVWYVDEAEDFGEKVDNFTRFVQAYAAHVKAIARPRPRVALADRERTKVAV